MKVLAKNDYVQILPNIKHKYTAFEMVSIFIFRLVDSIFALCISHQAGIENAELDLRMNNILLLEQQQLFWFWWCSYFTFKINLIGVLYLQGVYYTFQMYCKMLWYHEILSLFTFTIQVGEAINLAYEKFWFTVYFLNIKYEFDYLAIS